MSFRAWPGIPGIEGFLIRSNEWVLHNKSLVYGMADQVRHDRSVYAMLDRVSVISDWLYALVCKVYILVTILNCRKRDVTLFHLTWTSRNQWGKWFKNPEPLRCGVNILCDFISTSNFLKFCRKMYEFNFQDTMFLGVSPKKAPLREVWTKNRISNSWNEQHVG